MTQTQTKHDGTGRRTFLKGVATVPFAAAGIGAMSAPAQANIVQSAAGVGISGPAYLVGRVKDHFDGIGSEDDYEDLEEESLYIQTRQDMRLAVESNEQVLTPVKNLLENAKSVSYQLGRSKLIERLNEEDSFGAAQAEAEDELRDYFVTTEKNVVERWETFALQIELADDRGSETGLTLFEWDGFTDGSNANRYNSATYEYIDGSTEDYTKIARQGNEDAFFWDLDGDADSTADIEMPSKFGYDSITIIEDSNFIDILDDIESIYDDAIDELRDFADGFQDEYVAGDIDTEDLVSPRDLWQMSSDDSDNPFAAADLSGLGLEINQDSSVEIDLLDDEEMREGDVYLSKSPIGESLEVGLVYDPTESRSTDDDGDPDDDLDDYEGDADDPVPIDGLSFVAYNTDDGESTYEEIDQPFRVIEAFDTDGEELDNVSYEPSTGQQTTTTDVDELRDELETMNDEVIRLEEERAEMGGGGAGGFLAGDNTTIIGAAVAAAGAFVLFGGDS